MSTKTARKRKPSTDYGDVVSGRVAHFLKLAFTALANHRGQNTANAVEHAIEQTVLDGEDELREMGAWNESLEALKESK